MKFEPFLASMEKNLLHFWRRPDESEKTDYQNWLRTIYEGVSFMDPFHFEQATKEVALNAPRYRQDLRADRIVACYHRVAERNGWFKDAQGAAVTEDYAQACMRMLANMKPAGARYVLSRWEAGEVKYPEEVVQKLLLLAGKEEAKVA